MANRWVYVRGFPMLPHDTTFYTACANNLISNIQTLCALPVIDVDISFFPTIAFVSVTYESTSAIDLKAWNLN